MATPFPIPDNLSEDSTQKFATIHAKVSGGSASINYLLNELQNTFQEIDKAKANEQQPYPPILFARRNAIEFDKQDQATRKERDEHMEQLYGLHDDLSQTLSSMETANPEVDHQTIEHLAGIALSFGSLVIRIGLLQSSLDANADELAVRVDVAEKLGVKALGTALENKADDEVVIERADDRESCNECAECSPTDRRKRKRCADDYASGHGDGYRDYVKQLEDGANPQNSLVGGLTELLQTLKERGSLTLGAVRTLNFPALSLKLLKIGPHISTHYLRYPEGDKPRIRDLDTLISHNNHWSESANCFSCRPRPKLPRVKQHQANLPHLFPRYPTTNHPPNFPQKLETLRFQTHFSTTPAMIIRQARQKKKTQKKKTQTTKTAPPNSRNSKRNSKQRETNSATRITKSMHWKKRSKIVKTIETIQRIPFRGLRY